MATTVLEIEGIGPQTAKILQEHGFKTAEAIVKAGKNKLMAVPGFAAVRAQNTIEAAKLLVKTASKKTPKKDKNPKAKPNKSSKDKKSKGKKKDKVKKKDKDKSAKKSKDKKTKKKDSKKNKTKKSKK